MSRGQSRSELRSVRGQGRRGRSGQTLGEVLADLDARLFVGRQAELDLFESRLTTRESLYSVLHVWGPGGIGKTALLRAFARIAQRHGREVVSVDGRDIRPEPGELAAALGGRTLESAVDQLNQKRAIVLLDAFELLVDLTRVLQREVLPILANGILLVVAGRQPLGVAWEPWRPLIRDVALGRLAAADARTYLARREIRDIRLVDQILSSTRGLPLALSLVADLVVQTGIHDLSATGEWHRLVRSLVEQLLADTQNTLERELLEAGAVVRHFDEATLAALAGRDDIGPAFARLCELSIVRPGRHGLVLHDDVRHILAEDLRWRQPDRYRALRLRAIAYYRERARQAGPAERGWLLGDRLALWENAFIQAMLFTEAEAGRVWLDWGHPEDHDEIRRIWTGWVETWLGAQVPLHCDRAVDQAFLDDVLAYPGTQLRVARDADNRIVGFSSAIPICGESIALLESNPGVVIQLRAMLRKIDARRRLVRTAASASAYFFCHLAQTEVEPEATQQALIRDVFGLLARGGVYLASTPVVAYKALFETLGFVRLADAQSWFWSAQEPEQGYILDLTRTGVESWIEAIVAGRQPPRALSVAEVEQSLQAEVFPHWRDDAQLASSALASQLCPFAASDAERARSLRSTLTETIERIKQHADEQRLLALRAIDGAYLLRRVSNERLAEELGVSRSTLYRLLHRGTADVAAGLDAQMSDGAKI